MATQLKFDVTALDRNAAAVFNRLATVVERFERQLDKLDGKKVNAEVGVDTAKAEREVGAFATNTRRKLETALRNLPELEITADSSDTDRAVAKVREDLASLRDKTVGIDITADEAIAETRRIRLELDRLANDKTVDVQVRADAAAAMADLAAVEAAADKVDRKRATVKVDVDRSLGDALIHVTRLTEALGKIALPAGAVAAAPQIASIGAAAVTATGALWLIPAAGIAAGAAITTLVLGFKNFGDAVGDDPKKAAEAMAELAPSARDAAKAVNELAPAWSKVQQAVQGALFDKLGDSLRQLSGVYLPVVRTSLVGIADGFNDAARQSAAFAGSRTGVAQMSGVLTSSQVASKNLSAALEPVTEALFDIAEVGAARLPILTSGLGNAALKMAQFVDQARASGDLGRWIDNGVDALRTLGSIAGNVGGSLSAIFTASRAAGADFLSTLDNLTGRMRDFLNSAQGQNALVSLFQDIRAGVEAATPGVEALVTAIAGVVQALGDAGVLQAAGEAFSAIAEQIAPLIDMVGGLAGPFAALLDVVGALAPVLVPAAVALAGFWAAAKLMDGFDTIRGKVSGFTGALGNVRTAAGEGGAMGAIRTLGGALGAGGILGIALAGAGIALDIWATKNANAKQAAAEHKAKVDELAGSFDKVTGAASSATREIQAQELTSVKLKDGTTSLATALGQLGISTSDYVDATTGNVAKQQAIAEKLNAVTQAAIEQSPVWRNNSSEVQRWGVSLDDVVAAANGNVQAQDRLTDAAKRNAGGVLENEAANQMLVDSLLGLGGTAGEVGSQFGAAIGTFNEAKTSFDTTKQAVQDFATALDTVKIGLSGLKDGAAPLPAMVEGFRSLGASATTAAQGAGEAAAKLGGVKAGGDAAAAAMQQSRDAFIGAATGAGLSADQAARLADQIGLIPAAARTNFETNATGAAAEINTLNAQLAAVPGQKTVTVDALSEEAQGKLRDLGFTVTTLPNGQVQVDVKDEAGRQKLADFVAFGNGQVTVVKIDGDPNPANGKITATVQLGNGQTAVMTYDARPDPATGKINATVDLGNGKTATMKLDADPRLANGQISGVVTYGNGQTATIKVATSGVPAANSAIDNAARNRQTYIDVKYRLAGNVPAGYNTGGGQATGGIVSAMADGGVLPMAGGGMWNGRRMTAAQAGVAKVYPPNMPRIIGDRIRDDEAYIPLDRSGRSRTILGVAADRMGYDLVPRDRLPGPVAGTGTSLPAAVRAVSSVARPAASGASQLVGALARAGALQAAEIATLRREMAGLAAAVREARPITVEDHSGDPTETARATRLVLRM